MSEYAAHAIHALTGPVTGTLPPPPLGVGPRIEERRGFAGALRARRRPRAVSGSPTSGAGRTVLMAIGPVRTCLLVALLVIAGAGGARAHTVIEGFGATTPGGRQPAGLRGDPPGELRTGQPP